jgi:hypothetical protein
MRRLQAMLCLALPALALAGCGAAGTTATSSFSGAKREVAQTIADFQSDSSSAEEKKVCANDLAAGLVSRLGGKGGCEEAIKRQLDQTDDLEVAIESVDVAASGKTATATVRSIHEGKTRASGLSFVKEGGKWRIAGE